MASTIRALQDILSRSKPQILFLAETKATDKKISKLKRRIQFPNSFHVNAKGRSGGLALFWKESCHLVILKSCKNFIHCRVNDSRNSASWFLTCVYGNPTFAERRGLWDRLSDLRPANSAAWCCLGDFNEILFQEDKDGVRPPNQLQIDVFRNFVDGNTLIDLDLKGSRFTWCNNREEGFVREKIDRVLVNAQWINNFPHAIAEAFPAIGSDHSPIVLHCEGRGTKRKKSFVYEHFWDEHPDCVNTVASAWNMPMSNTGSAGFVEKIEKVRNGLQSWSRRTFRRADKRIAHLRNEISRLQNARHSPEVVQSLSTYKREIDDLWKHEELFWKVRSRVKWRNHGDRNSRFFHTSTIQRRMSNRIGRIKDDSGEWIENDDDILNCFVDFYKNLFSSRAVPDRQMFLDVIPNLVTERMNEILLSPVSEAEVECATFGMGPHKSPGPDGLNGLFYQKNWATIKDDVVNLVKDFFETASIPSSVNVTHIALIPKIQNPEEVGQFRPISCCNYAYKIISKVLANRMKVWLGSLISHNQSAFVSKRLIQDNILVAQEVFHFLKSSKGKKLNSLAMKLDMYKAYDYLEWDFISKIMLAFGFDRRWVDLVMGCISTVSYRIKFNGSLSNVFSPSRGLRQGDPISPYLFILAAESLSRIISKAADEGSLVGIRLGKTTPILTHLFFADDAMILCQADRRNCFELVKILNMYTTASGQKINVSKSGIFFNKGCPPNIKSDLSGILGMHIIEGISVYLGIPGQWAQSKCQSL